MQQQFAPKLARSLLIGVFSMFIAMYLSNPAMGATLDLIASNNGHVFFPDEKIQMRLVVVLDGQQWHDQSDPIINYKVEDFWGTTVGTGQVPVVMSTHFSGWADVSIDFPDELRGWFRVDIDLVDGDASIPLRSSGSPSGDAYVTFAVIDPPAPGPQPSSYFAIGEHSLDDSNAELMRRAGMRWLRTDVLWGGIQSQPGDSFNWARMDNILSVADRYDIQVLPIINYTAPFAAEPLPGVQAGHPSRYPPREEDWRHFVRALVKRYKDRISVWEVWNEPNAEFWLGTPEQYSDLLRQAYEEIHEVDPTARVSIGGTAGIPMAWLNAVRAAGGGPYIDIVSVHPYRQPAPPERGLIADIVRVQNWAASDLKPSLAGVTSRPIWITEMGYHTRGNDAAVSEKYQAKLLVRTMTQAFASGVERFFWYEFADGSRDASDSESNFGLVYHNLMPKPGYVAYATMERMLGSMDTSWTLAFDDRRIHAVSFNAGDKRAEMNDVVVAWALDEVQTVEWPARESVTVVDIMGARSVLTPPADSPFVNVSLSESPVYITGLDLAAMETLNIASISDDPLAVKDAPVATGDINLVINGSFEERVSDLALPVRWSRHVNHGANFAWEYRLGDNDVPDGVAYLRLRNQTPKTPHVYGRIHQVIPVKPWTTYTLTAKVRTKGNHAGWIGGGPGWGVRFQLPQDTHGEWEDVYGVFTSESEYTWELMVLLEDVVEYVDVDDIRIVEGVLPPNF